MTKHHPPSARLEDLKPGTEWTSVPGFSRYWISRNGVVAYEDDLRQFRIKATPRTQSGHRLVLLTSGQTRRSVTLIRLMAETFLGAPTSPAHRWVRPIDGNIDNVTVENLSWTDVSPARGKKKQTLKSHAEKTELAAQVAKMGSAAVAEKTGLPLTYIRHLKPNGVYAERNRSSPPDVSCLQLTPPINPDVEEWRQILDARGYDVSSFGRVRSWRGLAVQEHIPVRAGDYLKAMLRTGNTARQTAVHRLVAAAFCPRKRPEQTVVNHKDGNKLNNHYSNLEWVTHAENMKHAHDAGLWQVGPTHGKRWQRPPPHLYTSLRDGSVVGTQWHPSVVQALRQGLGWPDQGERSGEEWRPIEDRWGLETPVEVSTDGRVRRSSNKTFLLQGLSTHGYPVTRLHLGSGKGVAVKTHTLVAEAFIGRRPSDRHVVNHKDCNKQNNSVNNLEWSTYAENSKHWSDSRG
jgi:hypothetical protein